MKLDILKSDKKIKKQIEISDKIFTSKDKGNLVHRVIYWQQSIMKQRKAKTKQRNEIVGSTSKIYAQKGTGGARHSSRKAPIFVGGGIAHGPKGDNYKIKKINKKVKKGGLISVLAQKINDKNLFVVEDFDKKIKKTKEFNKFLIDYDLRNSLFVLDKNSKANIYLSAQNIPNIKTIEETSLNVLDMLKFKKIVFTISSIKFFQDRLIK